MAIGKVQGQINVSAGFSADAMSIYQQLIYAVQQLNQLIVRILNRLNQSLPEDGSEAMTAPLPLSVYTIATRPAAATTGSMIYVSDATAGQRLQAWNGSAWVAGG